MALTRTELLARGLVRAQELTGKDVPVVSLLDNPNISSLSPEEKVEIIKRYSELTGHDVEYHGTPLHKEVVRGAMYGAGLAVPFGMMSGKLTFAPPGVISDAAKAGKKPLKEIFARTAKPLAKVLGLGAMIGGTAGLMQGIAKANTNKYLSSISKSISQSKDEEDKRITAAALLTATPHLSKGFQSTGDIMRMHVGANLPRAIESLEPEDLRPSYTIGIPATEEYIPESLSADARAQYLNEQTAQKYPPTMMDNEGNILPHPLAGQTHGYQFKVPYDDWNYVKGIGGEGKVGWTRKAKN